ncbi:hypothetical protein EMIT0P228_150148 [Pseudomonas brassicacearum]
MATADNGIGHGAHRALVGADQFPVGLLLTGQETLEQEAVIGDRHSTPYCWMDRGCCSLWEQGLPAMKVTRSSGKPRRLHREQALLPQVPQAIGHRP